VAVSKCIRPCSRVACCNSPRMRSCKPKIRYSLGMHMQNKAPAAVPLLGTRAVSRPRATPPFVIRLQESTQPIEPRDVPQLDLFDLYHLYCHSEPHGGEMRHSLRLGYFKEPGNAKSIAAYLARYFRHPAIVQIGPAEVVASLRGRFQAEKDVGASGIHSTVVLETPPSPPTANLRVMITQSAHRDGKQGSFWSRLLDSLRRPRAAT
jgi:hypothetical protein